MYVFQASGHTHMCLHERPLKQMPAARNGSLSPLYSGRSRTVELFLFFRTYFPQTTEMFFFCVQIVCWHPKTKALDRKHPLYLFERHIYRIKPGETAFGLPGACTHVPLDGSLKLFHHLSLRPEVLRDHWFVLSSSCESYHLWGHGASFFCPCH